MGAVSLVASPVAPVAHAPALGDAMALACACAWAAAVMLYRRVRHLDPVALTLFKNLVALTLLVVTMVAAGIPLDVHRSTRDWVTLGTSGIMGLAVADSLFFAGLQRIDTSVAAVADCVYAPTVVLLSVLFLGEPLHGSIVVGAPLVVLGLFLVAFRGSVPSGTARPLDPRGLTLLLSGVFTTAVGVVLAKPALGRSHLVEVTTVRLAFGSVALGAATMTMPARRRAFTSFLRSAPFPLVLPAAVLGTYVCMLLWLGGMKYGTASRAALLNQLGAVFLLGLSRLAGERVSRRRWVGAALAVVGAAVVVAGR